MIGRWVRGSRVRRSRRLGVLAVTALVLPAQVYCQQGRTSVDVVAEEAARLHEILTTAAEEGFAGAVVIDRAGRPVLKAGYGLADRERGIPFTTRTIAQVGSLTKQFTAMAVVDLWRQGRLAFTDSVARHLARAPAPLANRTLHQLLTHTAGLPENCGPDFQYIAIAQLLSDCLAGEGAIAAAGSVSYSNVGYSLLGAVVEAVAGRDLQAYLTERFFEPLGMERTGYLFSPERADTFALGYGASGARRPISERIAVLGDAWWNLKGNGGMQTSAEDMHRWSVAVRRGPLITDEMRGAALRPHAKRDPDVSVGYGWFIRTDEAGRTVRISHTGSDGVFFSAALWYLESDTFVYLVGNSGVAKSLEVLQALLRELAS